MLQSTDLTKLWDELQRPAFHVLSTDQLHKNFRDATYMCTSWVWGMVSGSVLKTSWQTSRVNDALVHMLRLSGHTMSRSLDAVPVTSIHQCNASTVQIVYGAPPTTHAWSTAGSTQNITLFSFANKITVMHQWNFVLIYRKHCPGWLLGQHIVLWGTGYRSQCK